MEALTVSKWREVESVILKYIADRALREGDALPSDREFAIMAGCSMQPIMQAMRELGRKGLVLRRAGAATIVHSPVPLIDDREFSFSYNALHRYGQNLKNKLLELSCRLPAEGNFFQDEKKAQESLYLKRKEPFYVIVRLRLLDNIPRAIHRAYLNPSLFPSSFISDHNFEEESLIAIYNNYGFIIESRNTTLRARLPISEEALILKIKQEPLLDATQVMEASNVDACGLVTLEYMRACYLNWDFNVMNRRKVD
jgi:GntR family transcriptional regulator